jgi:hypothetical protein
MGTLTNQESFDCDGEPFAIDADEMATLGRTFRKKPKKKGHFSASMA